MRADPEHGHERPEDMDRLSAMSAGAWNGRLPMIEARRSVFVS